MVVGGGVGPEAIILSSLFPDLEITSADVLPNAALVTHLNAQLHGLENRFRIIISDLFSAVRDEQFDLIVLNAPLPLSRELLRVSGVEVLDIDGKFHRRLFSELPPRLSPRGRLLISSSAYMDQVFMPASLVSRKITPDLPIVEDFYFSPSYAVFCVRNAP